MAARKKTTAPAPYTPKGGDPTRADFQLWAKLRYQEARKLLEAGETTGAVYFAGLAVELLLKAAVCRTLNEDVLPREFKIHNLTGLRTLAGLRREVEADPMVAGWFLEVETVWRSGEVRYSNDPPRPDVEQFFRILEDKGVGLWPWLVIRS